jgi:hypothetical protein
MDKTPKRVREEPVEPPPVQPKKKARKCAGCIEGQLNQMGHYGGCIPDPALGEEWEDCFV